MYTVQNGQSNRFGLFDSAISPKFPISIKWWAFWTLLALHVFLNLLDQYEIYDPCTTMFFYRNKHIMIDLGTGNNNKINWALEDKQEMIDIVETVYRGARKGRGLVVSPKDYSTKYRY